MNSSVYIVICSEFELNLLNYLPYNVFIVLQKRGIVGKQNKKVIIDKKPEQENETAGRS